MRQTRSDALSPEVKKARQKTASQKYIAAHKEVLSERQRVRRQADPEYRERQNAISRRWRESKKAQGTMSEYSRRQFLKRLYQLSLEQYNAMLVAQDGKCAVCNQPPTSGKQLAVDHDHTCCPERKCCGKCIRGLLCDDCNLALGKLKDNPDTIRRSLIYLDHVDQRASL